MRYLILPLLSYAAFLASAVLAHAGHLVAAGCCGAAATALYIVSVVVEARRSQKRYRQFLEALDAVNREWHEKLPQNCK